MYDDGIKINTTQNVLISYRPAGVGDRVLASLLDSLFMIGYTLIIFFIFSFGHFFRDFNDTSLAILSVFVMLPLFLYHLLLEQFNNGQSFGKKIMKIKVVKLDGTQPSFGAYLLRWILRVIDTLLFNGFIALITVALSDKSQRLGDMAAGTTVVSLKQKVSLKDTILHKTKPDYKIVFNEVSKLSDKDMGIIKEVFDYCTSNDDDAGMKRLAEKVKYKMGVTSTLKDNQFIKVVLMDYSQYQFEK